MRWRRRAEGRTHDLLRLRLLARYRHVSGEGNELWRVTFMGLSLVFCRR